ncbi:MAG: hypothetical protein D3920_00865 [Candidatus Electrothrix sp. AW2]|nr:hypothetical protein [Candidatus Electrothrix gigas]
MKIKQQFHYYVASGIAAALFIAQSASATPTTLTPASIDFPSVAAEILTYVIAAVLAGLTLFGAVQGVKIGINLFKSIARTATS